MIEFYSERNIIGLALIVFGVGVIVRTLVVYEIERRVRLRLLGLPEGWLGSIKPVRRFNKLERTLGLHEGGWVQLMFGRRVIWLTARAYNVCYLGLDDSARTRVDRELTNAIQDRFDLADLELMSR